MWVYIISIRSTLTVLVGTFGVVGNISGDVDGTVDVTLDCGLATLGFSGTGERTGVTDIAGGGDGRW